MTVAVQIPQPTETLFSRQASLSCAGDGVINAERPHGLFAGDTRVVSTYRTAIAGQPWQMLSRARLGAGAIEWTYQSPALQGPRGEVPEGTVMLTLKRRLGGALHDDYTLAAFTQGTFLTRLQLHIDADFADIFEVKEGAFSTRLNVQRTASDGGVQLLYERRGFRRGVELRFESSSGAPRIMGTLVVFDLELGPHTEWTCCVEAAPIVGRRRVGFRGDPHRFDGEAAVPVARGPVLDAPALLRNPVERGVRDLADLAVLGREEAPYPAAGAPWFVTLFGRDTLWVTLMTALFMPQFAQGTLTALRDLQAERFDDFRDEQPGKFLHEIRHGELTVRGVIPHSPYYGTHDAPALFCLALWNAWRWTGRDELLTEFLPAARKGLDWCVTLGDQDQDGLLEYQTRSRHGYFNQSWKDAGDAILHADGRLPELPLAVSELQGYWYAACLAAAAMLAHVGERGEAERLTGQAAELRRRVEERYWMEGAGFYAVSLDGAKRRVESIASNAGHLLWAGLPGRGRAAKVAARMLAPDMHSGWGLRTLSAEHPAYNPLSYQRGSVWPFDTLVCAAGLSRYGMHEAACMLIRGVLEAAGCFENDRLPELFGGSQRKDDFPVPYPRANVPQAWSAAAPLFAVQVFLGLVPDAPNGRCTLRPYLPDWLPYLELGGVAVGRGRLDVRLERDGGRTRISKLSASGVEVAEGFPAAPLWGDPA